MVQEKSGRQKNRKRFILKSLFALLLSLNFYFCTAQPSVTLNAANSPICWNTCTDVTATASGGTPPYTYSWTPALGTGAGPYQVCLTGDSTISLTVTDADTLSSTASITIQVYQLPWITMTPTDVLCYGDSTGSIQVSVGVGPPPYTYEWSSSSNTTSFEDSLWAGTFTVTVTDANGCIDSLSADVHQPASRVSITLNSLNADCGQANGVANVAAFGGTPGYIYAWSNGPTTPSDTGLTSGMYTVLVTDSNGCAITDSVFVNNNPGPDFSISGDVTIVRGESAQLHASGGATYSWAPSGGLNCTSCSSPTASPTQTTTYCVAVVDSFGCSFSSCLKVTVEDPCGEIFIPNAFSPNADGENEFECVYGKCLTSMTFIIYDRWGDKVFESTDIHKCWNGVYNGTMLNSAVFVYYFQGTLSTGEKVTKKGNISLIR